MRKIIVDTNLLLDDAKVLDKLSREYDKIVIPLVVLKELDKHKLNPDMSYSARNAIYAILNFKERNEDKLVFSTDSSNETDNNDSKIIDTAIRTGSDIATKDISMSIISEAKGINTLLYDVVINNLFNPYIYIEMDDILKTYKEFCFNQIYEKYDYEKLSKGIKGLDKDAWMFIFIRHENEIRSVYANNPIKECLERIDNLPEYRDMEVDNTIIRALDIYQVCAFYAFKEAPNVLLTGKWGSGKTLLGTSYAIQNSNRKIFITRPPIGINRKYDVGFFPGPQPVDAKILSPTGWTTMGSVKKEDYVIGRNGKKTKVLEVFDKGIKPVYRVETTNGGITEACGDHLWLVKDENSKKHNKGFGLKSTLEIKESILNPNKGPKYNYSLPCNDPVEFETPENLPIPSYTMGVLLGDGSFSNSISIINIDKDIIERIKDELAPYGMHLHKNRDQYFIHSEYRCNKPPKPVKVTNINTGIESIYDSTEEASDTLGINKTTINSRCTKGLTINDNKYEFLTGDKWRNYVKNAIYILGLEGAKSYNKFIPDMYKYTSIENRIDLLQGLMDSDGSIKKSDGSQEYTTVSKQLADDIIEVVRSLGINATKYNRNRIGNVHEFKNKEINTKHVSYQVCIPKHEKFELFYCSRKRNRIKKCVNRNHYNKIKNIEYIGDKHVKCILLDNEDHLYITDDYIITHNTKEDKMLNWFAGFLSSVYYIYANTRGQHNGAGIEYDYVKDKIFKEKFETVPINAIQGMSLLDEDILIVDELQLIDVDYLSMILSRSGSGSKIILLGDLAQTYGVVRPSESGLLKLLRLLPHKNIAYVSLQNSYRSGLLDLADKLQEKVIN